MYYDIILRVLFVLCLIVSVLYDVNECLKREKQFERLKKNMLVTDREGIYE
jgi:hypothetical protein